MITVWILEFDQSCNLSNFSSYLIDNISKIIYTCLTKKTRKISRRASIVKDKFTTTWQTKNETTQNRKTIKSFWTNIPCLVCPNYHLCMKIINQLKQGSYNTFLMSVIFLVTEMKTLKKKTMNIGLFKLMFLKAVNKFMIFFFCGQT